MNITLLPADNYLVINKTNISEFDNHVLVNLYQPIIGPIALSLYFTFISELDKNNEKSNIHNHHHLMVSLKSSLDIIKKSLEALESVGLIRSFVKECDNQNKYIYEIYSPISPNEFFHSSILNVILYNNIGEREYNDLVSFYKKPKVDMREFKDISKSLSSTFVSINSNLVNDYEMKEKDIIGINVGDSIDMDTLISGIPKNIISDKAFNKNIKELINSYSFVYDIDTLRMIDLVRMSIDDNGMINKETLSSNIRKYYDFSSNGNLPTLVYRTQPEYLKEKYTDTSNRGKMLYVFENKSPYDFLMGKNKGVKPSSRDLKILEYLAVDLKMKPAVINVLIDYVLRINDNKLNKNYIDAIASQWIRSNIETASKAMEFAEKEHKKVSKKTVKKDNTVPVWFNDKNDSKDISDDERNELENLLKEFK